MIGWAASYWNKQSQNRGNLFHSSLVKNNNNCREAMRKEREADDNEKMVRRDVQNSSVLYYNILLGISVREDHTYPV